MSLLSRLTSIFTGGNSANNQESANRLRGPLPIETASRPVSPPAPKPEPKPEIKPGRYSIHGGSLVALDDQIDADVRIELLGCKQLKSLPADLKTGTLDLTGCTALERLPQGMDVAFLDLADCTALIELPNDLKLRGGRLNLKNCDKVQRLPDNMGSVAQLNLSGCRNITALPAGLTVTSWVDISNSGITSLPDTMAHVSVRR